VLPCPSCSKSYNLFISKEPLKITDDILENRQTLTKWVFDLHQTVNNKLCVNYDITYDDVVERYESFRVKCEPKLKNKKCIMPPSLRQMSYCNEYKKDCQIIPYKIVKCFVKYAQKRNVDFSNLDRTFDIYNKRKNDNKISEEWHERNRICDVIIKEMREQGIQSLESEGIYKNLPTLSELKLLSYMSSNLNVNELVKPIQVLGYKIKKMYKFSDI
jgi:hypothetical protein